MITAPEFVELRGVFVLDPSREGSDYVQFFGCKMVYKISEIYYNY